MRNLQQYPVFRETVSTHDLASLVLILSVLKFRQEDAEKGRSHRDLELSGRFRKRKYVFRANNTVLLKKTGKKYSVKWQSPFSRNLIPFQEKGDET